MINDTNYKDAVILGAIPYEIKERFKVKSAVELTPRKDVSVRLESLHSDKVEYMTLYKYELDNLQELAL